MQILGYITFSFKGLPSLKSILFRLEKQHASVKTYCGYFFYVCVKGAPNCAQGLHFNRLESRELNRRPRHFWSFKIFLKYFNYYKR